jgi:NADH-quinone oxidoreductase subunit J
MKQMICAALALLLPLSAGAQPVAQAESGAPVVVTGTAAAPQAVPDTGAPLIEQYQEGGGIARQSSNVHAVFFFVGAAVALFGAFVVIFSRRPMRSALGLLITVLATAGLYLLLRAELLAALQVLIYAGAVVVLLVFVITFLDQGAIAAPGGRRLPLRFFAVLAVAWVMYLVGQELLVVGLGTLQRPGAGFGTTAGLGHALFTTYVVPFEAVSALLLTAIVGAVAVAKGKGERGTAATTTTTAAGSGPGSGAGSGQGGE